MTPTLTAPTAEEPTVSETDDLLESLATHRAFFRTTVQGLTEDQARTRSTVSQLTLAGLVKHLGETEDQWVGFCQRGGEVFVTADWTGDAGASYDPDAPRPDFTPTDEETLAVLLDRYDAVAARTADVVRALPDLNATHQLPVTPWWPEGGAWSVRRALLHVIAETAQHAGHADLLRESIDGQKTMG